MYGTTPLFQRLVGSVTAWPSALSGQKNVKTMINKIKTLKEMRGMQKLGFIIASSFKNIHNNKTTEE